MALNSSDYKKIDNEVVFRKSNEQVTKGIEKLKQISEEEEQFIDIPGDNKQMHYFCECSDENCRIKIVMTIGNYKNIHKKRNRFVIVPGHGVMRIEKIITQKPNYEVVEKLIKDIPDNNVTLKRTNTHNV